MSSTLNLQLLKVSLTKHGVHKIARLLVKYSSGELLSKLKESGPGLKLERAQVAKTLCADEKNGVPKFWDEARVLGSDAIDGLVLIAIISSHIALIELLKVSETTRYKGKVIRGKVISGKAYSNFKHTLVELGYSTSDSELEVEYDFERLFRVPRLNELAKKLFKLKFRSIGWDSAKTIEDELIAVGFHSVFSVTENEFRTWLSRKRVPAKSPSTINDKTYFAGDEDDPQRSPIVFQAGHKPKKHEASKVSFAAADRKIEFVHNQMQTTLFNELVKEHGEDCVGTEIDSGCGTSIDLVVQTTEFRCFYEIKTADSVKGCIRQAIPQLLEYAYWQTADQAVDKLIIVGPPPLTPDAEAYLERLRTSFSIPIYYQQLNA